MEETHYGVPYVVRNSIYPNGATFYKHTNHESVFGSAFLAEAHVRGLLDVLNGNKVGGRTFVWSEETRMKREDCNMRCFYLIPDDYDRYRDEYRSDIPMVGITIKEFEVM